MEKANQNLLDRLTRAESWLRAASNLEANRTLNEVDAQTAFLYRYIAFNSLYGLWKFEGSAKTTWIQLDRFFANILTLHSEDRHRKGTVLKTALLQCQAYWVQLMDNEFLDNGYWAKQEHHPGFREKYHSAKFGALRRLSQEEYTDLLHSIFSRIVVLRNQIVHGCTTFGPVSLGWKSVTTANPVLRALVPAFHSLMARYPDSVDWPPIPYPRRGSAQHPKRPLGT
jgi:hypothetical protein